MNLVGGVGDILRPTIVRNGAGGGERWPNRGRVGHAADSRAAAAGVDIRHGRDGCGEEKKRKELHENGHSTATGNGEHDAWRNAIARRLATELKYRVNTPLPIEGWQPRINQKSKIFTAIP